MRGAVWIGISIGFWAVAGGCAGSQRQSVAQSGQTATPSSEQSAATRSGARVPPSRSSARAAPQRSSERAAPTPSRASSRPEPFSPRPPWKGRAGERERSEAAARATTNKTHERQPVAGEETAETEEQRPLYVLEGRATYYASTFDGRLTKSGEPYDPEAMTAATKASGPPLGAVLRVVRRDTGASVTVRVNDRMPEKAGAIVDLSRAAAYRLDMIDAGIVPVRIDVLSVPEAEARPGGATQ